MTEIPAQIRPGSSALLGATYDGHGVNFAVFSEHATLIELCLFDPADPSREVRRMDLPEKEKHVWHGRVAGLRPGTLYGFRGHGPYEPATGLLFNPAKLLVDPYARAISGKVDFKYPVYGYQRIGDVPDEKMALDPRDDAPGKPKCVVIDDRFDWAGDARPNTPWHRTIIYEVHVKGFTRRNPDVPPELRGTYAGLATPAAIAHLRKLGVTAVELMPIHEHSDEDSLVRRKLTNCWGYNTLGFFAPEQLYSSRGSTGGQVADFKAMVKALHREGIEVILDVVYNHTAEGNQWGPTLCFKGLDNRAYYRLSPEDPRHYVDFTGTGSSLNVLHPQALKLIADSMRYWAQEMHVDGFRVDLATTLGREARDFNPRAALFQIVHQDPVLSRLKLIAEPWDLGEGGYQVGNFPVLWAEWNGRYRDVVRRYWLAEQNSVAELGYRLTGSSDLYELSGRGSWASINYVISHDGFTLHDLVSYSHKHNEANGEENRDGANENYSFNFGHEGETEDPKIRAIREQQKRNLLATLLLSEGVPMLSAGDEMGKTQRGNNNAYCQDNEISWLDWELDDARRALLEFTAKMIRFRHDQPVLQRPQFFHGAHIWESDFKDLAWFRPDGQEMSQEDWANPQARSLGFLLGGDAIPALDEHGNRVVGDTLLVLMNPLVDAVDFTLPEVRWGVDWEIVIDTANPEPLRGKTPAGEKVQLASRALMVLCHLTRGEV
ncbi:MAG TPA: glycogen debranching protein GlgX [Myxococcaceae bacterium]|nr:glycogen debranching protein GlgX [Myxococcaceae bacterium]